MCARLPRGVLPHAPRSARVVFVCAGGRERDGGDAPPAGISSPTPIPGRTRVARGAEPPTEQLRPRPLLGPRPRGGTSAAGPLEEGSLAGVWGAECWGLFLRLRGRAEGQPEMRVRATGGTLSRAQSPGRHALHLAQAFFLTVSILDPPTPGALRQPWVVGRIAEGAPEAGAFKKGRVHALHSGPSGLGH